MKMLRKNEVDYLIRIVSQYRNGVTKREVAEKNFGVLLDDKASL